MELARKNTLLKQHAALLEKKNVELEQANTELRRAEQEIGRLNQHLERRIVELSNLNRELDSFSHTVSHDLRAPLIRMDGFCRAIEESWSEKLDEQGKIYLSRVRSSSQRMCQLIDDLLNFSRAGRAELRPEPVDLSSMARGLAEELRARDPSRQVEFNIGDKVIAIGDAALLRVVLVNLLENAWKFTRKQKRASIQFGVTRQDSTPVYFVKDDGAGFDPVYAHKLFRPFERLHPTAEFEGTGVGLATVERIVTRHGGRIWAEGAVDHGATFNFTLEGR